MGFSKEFLWGGATSSSQYEGGYNQGGRSLTITDFQTGGSRSKPRYITYLKDGERLYVPMFGSVKPKDAALTLFEDAFYPNHVAVDFYHRYKEDIALFAEMGFKVFRMSICWSRIYPNLDDEEPCQEGLAFYRSVLEELRKYGIKALVTMDHFDEPIYIEENGGWRNRKTVDLYVKYGKTLIDEYHDLVEYWLPFNEINGPTSLGLRFYSESMSEEEREKTYQEAYQTIHHQLLASAIVTRYGHEKDSNLKFGCMIACGPGNYPFTCDPKDVFENLESTQEVFYCSDVVLRGEYPYYARKFWNRYHVSVEMEPEDLSVLKEGTGDFYSFSYYTTTCITTHENAEKASGNFSMGAKNPYITYSEWGWGLDPLGLRFTLNQIYDRYQKPIFIVENGLGAVDVMDEEHKIHDRYRIDYLREHITAMRDALEDGVDLIGYTMWGCVDLISGSTGEIKKRYGLIYVDVDSEGQGTYDRYRKDSFYWYQKVIATNGEDLA